MPFPSVFGANRLALGTAQLGLPYGVVNTSGFVDYKQAEAILAMASEASIDTVDTAVAYGKSEAILGSIGISDFRIISKLPPLPQFPVAVSDWVVKQVEYSLKRLRAQRISGLLLHMPSDLLSQDGPKLVCGLCRVKELGLVDKVGLSVYEPEQLDKLVHLIPIDIVQVPFNAFDRRFADSGWLNKLTERNIEIHARSIFLQGLLLVPWAKVPTKFARFNHIFKKWYCWLDQKSERTSPVQACLAHVSSYPSISRMVVGIDSLTQLEEIISFANSTVPHRAPPSLSSNTKTLIMPTEWHNL